MKKTVIYSLFCLISATGFAQDNIQSSADWSPEIYSVGKKYPGYIIQPSGDTVKGFLEAKMRCAIGGVGNSNQNLAEFYLNENDKKPTAKYKPEDIKGYMIADKVYESIAYSGGMLKKANFNLVITDGAIRIYEWYSTREGFALIQQQSGEDLKAYDARRFDTKTIIAKGGVDPIEYGILGMQFAKKMPPLIADNKEMAEKVANKEDGYKFLQMFAVIEEYNKWKAEN
jgi:hypothetical protein